MKLVMIWLLGVPTMVALLIAETLSAGARAPRGGHMVHDTACQYERMVGAVDAATLRDRHLDDLRVAVCPERDGKTLHRLSVSSDTDGP